jgi:hypothetical protein
LLPALLLITPLLCAIFDLMTLELTTMGSGSVAAQVAKGLGSFSQRGRRPAFMPALKSHPTS